MKLCVGCERKQKSMEKEKYRRQVETKKLNSTAWKYISELKTKHNHRYYDVLRPQHFHTNHIISLDVIYRAI